MRLRLLTGLIAFGAVLFSFQNCAQVELMEQPISERVEYRSGKVSLCFDQQYAKYTIESIVTANLNLASDRKGAALDTDGDGLSDTEEVRYGLNPLKRRSDGKHLDSICIRLSSTGRCTNLGTVCTRTRNALGLSDCDWLALNLDSVAPHPTKGLDTDKDSVVDLLEIMRGTSPDSVDNLADPDHDLVRNSDEIAAGSNPFFYDQPYNELVKIEASASRLPVTNCGGEEWLLDIKQFPWIPRADAVSDETDGTGPAGALSLTRPKDTNTALIVIKLAPRVGETGNSKVLYRSLIVGSSTTNMDGTLIDFKEAGEVSP